MKILIGVTQKMKLYNVYHLCKQNIEYLSQPNIFVKSQKECTYEIKDWENLKLRLDVLKKVPALNSYVEEYIENVPSHVMEGYSYILYPTVVTKLDNAKNVLCTKMRTIIELYESMNIDTDGYGIDIKLPVCEDLSEYISYLKDINFIFSQCPFLQCKDETVKFGAVDVGSNWIKLTVAAASTLYILTNMATLIDKALVLRSHYITIQQQEEILRSQQIKNNLAETQAEFFDTLRTLYVNQAVSEMESADGRVYDPEERSRAVLSLDKLILFLDKGGEIYASLDSPEDVQALFPEMQSSLELPDNIIKYLENRETE